MHHTHRGTVELETERLMLRRFILQDAEAMFTTWSSDEDVAKYMRWDAHRSVRETEQVIAGWCSYYEKPDFYLWAITWKETGAPVGSLGMFRVNEADSCYEVAYSLGKAYWSKGIVTEALRAVLEFGFRSVGINRIEAYHSVNNPGSGRVMQKCGMKCEGHARQKYRSHEGFEDCDLYAVLNRDLCG